ncbi:YbhB/YbcL family Raf kinase inhibitor-like protein [Desulfobacula toluolica]|uniref:Phosphatidylethanolamine-binding protein n=1 Tax=Desulfobacula toluolica (strain DSM 7467 / Tol2) TaxID=651182 RepID=K0NHP8_DESTT|nr:YbhB/YbcL family Raf kinase inhibitor-like protein [Desulfobacula toluolica]CCK80846.1 phosphatidylethanolamine-binding protein [Desulfobacula toluolica Tol2]CCK80865.1 phosphatidylethanolamine-binding protein [Desulfobacula toluolica Tol2]CCK80882.1 phosphatidylethanolamine-binding protein [Desulfobacula toluolica Tol2]CCK80903.1 phosphatidylethanolamine-binding protein [Desulfobacula toluolica Tol2]CCK80922.1 phosphatidylethanolamine-binding protein [Desulfobacula toluolica Tol2]
MFTLKSKVFRDSGKIPEKYAEKNSISPPVYWENIPQGTKSFALAVTDPDLPQEIGFPRVFAHWLIYNIPSSISGLLEGTSPDGELPDGSKELNSDFFTFNIPGYNKGYGGPWPPDSAHRYVFTLYALKEEKIDIPESGDYFDFVNAVLPNTITTAVLIGYYGPAVNPLPKE